MRVAAKSERQPTSTSLIVAVVSSVRSFLISIRSKPLRTTIPAMHCRRSVRKLIELWETYQVELQGRYSLARLADVVQYAKESTRTKDLVVLLLTPLPGLVSLIIMDLLPLNSPTLGVLNQTIGLYFRGFVAAWILAFMMTMQMHQGSPRLPLSSLRLWVISVIVGLVCLALFFVFGLTIGYPTPFVVQLLTPSWFVSLTSLLWMSWKSTLQSDPVARSDLTRYLTVFLAQVGIIIVYTVISTVFRQIPGNFQTFLSLCLPLVKLFFKNWISKGVHHMEDLAPTTIVLNVDVFHAMFISSTMQQSSTFGSTAAVMLVDVGQSLVAYGDLHTLMSRVNRLAHDCQGLDDSKRGMLQQEPTTAQATAPVASRRRVTKAMLGRSVIDYAVHVLETRPGVREHPQVSLPRHLRPPDVHIDRGNTIEVAAVSTLVSLKYSRPNVQLGPIDADLRGQRADDPTQQSAAQVIQPELSQDEQFHAECVVCVLKMLHTAEFYILIEFVEVIVAGIYTLYMLALTYLPNRQYYNFLASLSHDEMIAMVERLAVYTSYELVSFVVFCLAVDRRLRCISSIQILAFVLRKHARMVQTTLIMWVFFVVQLNFQHLGTDYTFKFEWLRNKP